MAMVIRKHWEFESICPQCQKTNHVVAPEGELTVRVRCEHCTHGYEYTHIVAEYTEVADKE